MLTKERRGNLDQRVARSPYFRLRTTRRSPGDATVTTLSQRRQEARRREVHRRLARTIVPLGDLAALTIAVVLTMPGTSSRLAVAYVVLALLLGAAQHQYAARITPGLHGAVSKLFLQSSLPLLALTPFVAGNDEGHLLALALTATVALFAFRVLTSVVLRSLRSHHVIEERTLVIGAGPQGIALAETLTNHPEYGLKPVGFLDVFAEPLNPPILGPPEELDAVLERHAATRVIIAFGGMHEPDLVRVLRTCETRGVAVYVMPRFFELRAGASEIEQVWGIPLVRLRRPSTGRWVAPVKRAFDVSVACIALVVCAALMGICALGVKLSSPGPVIFRQKRIGFRGEPFEVLKFRTMKPNDDSDTTWNVDNDGRVTRFGALLRRTSLDELPQLFNVLRGEMSIVGPRPERPHFVEHFEASIPRYADRHRLPVGITGWAQVHNLRGDTSIEERSRFDNAYIEEWSLWRDIGIMFRTATTMISRRP